MEEPWKSSHPTPSYNKRKGSKKREQVNGGPSLKCKFPDWTLCFLATRWVWINMMLWDTDYELKMEERTEQEKFHIWEQNNTFCKRTTARMSTKGWFAKGKKCPSIHRRCLNNWEHIPIVGHYPAWKPTQTLIWKEHQDKVRGLKIIHVISIGKTKYKICKYI